MTTALVWFRQDLRLADNPALFHAATENDSIIPLYILDTTSAWSPGKAQQWWLHHSLVALQDQCKKLGLTLILKKGNPRQILLDICREQTITAIYWNRCYEPAAIERDSAIKIELVSQGIKVQSYNASLLHEPWQISNKQGDYFKVFTPYWNKCNQLPLNTTILPIPPLKQVSTLKSDDINAWNLLPSHPNWAQGFDAIWQPGELPAQQKLKQFTSELITDYADNRDFPEIDATSKLSPHLHFGEISPKQVWHRIKLAEVYDAISCEKFLRELGWREFSYYLLYHFPTLPSENFQPKFNTFAWADDQTSLSCWQKGLTGFSIVDAGMRELWHTGYMHNRVRMIAASFLTKHLLIDWRLGAEWFWDTLVDADLANNSMNWQWVAGCGVDAAPYFRIFNPILQGEKFDPNGVYIRRWVPELTALPKEYIHQPWEAPDIIQQKAGVIIGSDYPKPIINHSFARKRALERYRGIQAVKKR